MDQVQYLLIDNVDIKAATQPKELTLLEKRVQSTLNPLQSLIPPQSYQSFGPLQFDSSIGPTTVCLEFDQGNMRQEKNLPSIKSYLESLSKEAPALCKYQLAETFLK